MKQTKRETKKRKRNKKRNKQKENKREAGRIIGNMKQEGSLKYQEETSNNKISERIIELKKVEPIHESINSLSQVT